MVDEFRDMVASKLLNFRFKNNLTQQQAADILGCSNTTLNYIENRKDTVRKITLIKILNKLEKEK